MSFEKIIQLDEHLTSRKLRVQEPTVQLLNVGGLRLVTEKTASEASDWAKSIKPEPGKTYILVLALGATEYYGPNRNGDGFQEAELKKTYKTFETDAKVYKSHVNKDPAKSYGDVVRAFYNDRMHRVELVLAIDNVKAPDIVAKIKEGETVAVSMGCRIKFDVCTICGNQAPSRNEYCDHLKFDLGNILPDGRIVAADNPNPVFFDISVVWRPADRTGYMLKKVAQATKAVSSAELAEKAAALTVIASELNKAADMTKQIDGAGFGANTTGAPDDKDITAKWLSHVMPKILKDYQEFSKTDLKSLSGSPTPQVLASLGAKGIFLTTPEFLDLVFYRVTGSPAPAGLAENIITLQSDIFDLLAKHPEIPGEVFSSGMLPGEPSEELDDENPELAAKMGAYVPKRSLLATNLYYKVAYTPDTMTLPNGAQFQTSDQEIRRAQDFNNYADLVRVAGSAAGGLAAYLLSSRLMGGMGGLGKILALIPGVGAAGAIHSLTGSNANGITDAGKMVPEATLMQERFASIRQMPWVPKVMRQADINWMVRKHGASKTAALFKAKKSSKIASLNPGLGLEKTASALGLALL